ncbi:MAG: GNAT family N-acetyltransferase, partial [Schaalia sp.]|nr:GNAT family N-acetyltransferase [Schaalia sp.]
FYARHGFEIVGEYSFMVGDHADRELITRRPARLPVE